MVVCEAELPAMSYHSRDDEEPEPDRELAKIKVNCSKT